MFILFTYIMTKILERINDTQLKERIELFLLNSFNYNIKYLTWPFPAIKLPFPPKFTSKTKFCTCPPKFSFNIYVGCPHRCLYCFASSNVKNFNNCRPKEKFISRLLKEEKNIRGRYVSFSSFSDPYPPIEKNLLLTRDCLKIFSRFNCKVHIITKSSLILRDMDILKKMRVVIAMTITTVDDKISKILEPNVPLSSERIKVVKLLIQNKIPVVVRIDPIIPFLNVDQEKLVKKLAEIGVPHITSATYKASEDDWNRFRAVFPEVAQKLKSSYFEEGEKFENLFYLPKNLRFKLMKNIKEITEEQGLTFACCKEGFKINSATCDGCDYIKD